VSGAEQTIAVTSGAVLVGPGFSSIGTVSNPKDVGVGDLDGDGADEVVVLDGSAVRVLSPGQTSSLHGAGISLGGVDRLVVGDFLGSGNATIVAVDMDAGVATLLKPSGSTLVAGGSVDFDSNQRLTEVFARTSGGSAQLIALDSYVGEWKSAVFEASGTFATVLEDQPWRTNVVRDGNVDGDRFLAWYGREFGWIETEFGYGQDDGTDITVEVVGSSRYTTNVAVNRLAIDEADNVVLATSAKYPDALTAGAVADQLGGALLLTDRYYLPSAIAAEIQRLGATTVTIAGGPDAVSPAVEAAVAGLGVTVERVGGANRYETAARLSASAFPTADTVYIATGLNYPDALAGVPAAALRDAPILLVGNGPIPTSVVAELQRLSPTTVYILGGPVAVPNAVASQIASVTGVTPVRLGGANRYDTAVLISKDIASSAASVFVAPGTSFLDALMAGPVAARLGSPVLLVPNDVPGSVYNEAMRLRPDRLFLIGGALDEAVASGFHGIGPSTATVTLGFLPR
jgi:putative cell wall-binding protein